MRSNRAEAEIHDFLESEGWEIHSKGWPTFLITKGTAVAAIYVRSPSRRSPKAQETMMDVLKKAGMKVIIRESEQTGTVYRVDQTGPAETVGEASIFLQPRNIYVRCPYAEDFIQGARDMRGRFRPKIQVWSFRRGMYEKRVRALVQKVFGKAPTTD